MSANINTMEIILDAETIKESLDFMETLELITDDQMAQLDIIEVETLLSRNAFYFDTQDN